MRLVLYSNLLDDEEACRSRFTHSSSIFGFSSQSYISRDPHDHFRRWMWVTAVPTSSTRESRHVTGRASSDRRALAAHEDTQQLPMYRTSSHTPPLRCRNRLPIRGVTPFHVGSLFFSEQTIVIATFKEHRNQTEVVGEVSSLLFATNRYNNSTHPILRCHWSLQNDGRFTSIAQTDVSPARCPIFERPGDTVPFVICCVQKPETGLVKRRSPRIVQQKAGKAFDHQPFRRLMSLMLAFLEKNFECCFFEQ